MPTLFWYKGTNTDAEGAARVADAQAGAAEAGVKYRRAADELDSRYSVYLLYWYKRCSGYLLD